MAGSPDFVEKMCWLHLGLDMRKNQWMPHMEFLQVGPIMHLHMKPLAGKVCKYVYEIFYNMHILLYTNGNFKANASNLPWMCLNVIVYNLLIYIWRGIKVGQRPLWPQWVSANQQSVQSSENKAAQLRIHNSHGVPILQPSSRFIPTLGAPCLSDFRPPLSAKSPCSTKEIKPPRWLNQFNQLELQDTSHPAYWPHGG